MLVFADKPAGVSTHTSLSDAERSRKLLDHTDGFLELLAERRAERLWPVHRLDKETTGAICFASTAEKAEELRSAFETRSVKKRYLFLTDRQPKNSATDTIEHRSRIEKSGKLYVSKTGAADPNAITRFKLIESNARFALWEALPETGRPHQIRLHAEDLGIPVLGDALHGGTEFPALCLHSESLEIDSKKHSAKAPRFFTDFSLLENVRLCRWLSAIDRRERLRASGALLETETLRWIHTEGDPLRAEQFGEIVQLSWFSDREPNQTEWQSLNRLTEIMGWKNWYFQVRGDRGRAPNEEIVKLSSEDLPIRWNASERGLKFQFRRDSGLSPGLFLDQRANRAHLEKNSQGKSVLNLFCYTGGFSVAAAKGGATKVVSVDVSKTFLEWSKENFALNGIPIEGHEFRSIDAREYLAWATKKELKFDWIVCDPPSFGRSKAGVFRIEKDLDDLISALVAVLAPRGQLLFSVNFEGWDNEEFLKRVAQALSKLKNGAVLLPCPAPDWDFEMPHRDRNMKAVLVSRR